MTTKYLKLSLLSLLFLLTTLAFAQQKPSVLIKNPFKKVTLNFRNGDTISGIAKLNSFNKIMFKKNKDAEKTTYDHRVIKGLTVFIDSVERHYVYKIITEKKFRGKVEVRYHLLELILKGKVSIYLDDYEAYKSTTLNKNIGYTKNNRDHRFYIAKENADVVAPLGTVTTSTEIFGIDAGTTVVSINKLFSKLAPQSIYTIGDLEINPKSKYFKKIAEHYFSDCPTLMSKIKDGYYNKYGILSIINYYNHECE